MITLGIEDAHGVVELDQPLREKARGIGLPDSAISYDQHVGLGRRHPDSATAVRLPQRNLPATRRGQWRTSEDPIMKEIRDGVPGVGRENQYRLLASRNRRHCRLQRQARSGEVEPSRSLHPRFRLCCDTKCQALPRLREDPSLWKSPRARPSGPLGCVSTDSPLRGAAPALERGTHLRCCTQGAPGPVENTHHFPPAARRAPGGLVRSVHRILLPGESRLRSLRRSRRTIAPRRENVQQV